MPLQRFRPWQQSGFNLLEVLVSLVILAVGLLGLAGLALQGLQFNQSAYLRSQATLQAYDMADRIRANYRCLRYDEECIYTDLEGEGEDQNCNSATCGPRTMAEHDRYEWNTANAERLPEGAGTVERIDNTHQIFEITVTWQEDRLKSEPAEFTYWTRVER